MVRAVIESPTIGNTAVRPVREMSQPVSTDPELTDTVSGISNKPDSPGDAPITACKYSGRNEIIAVSAAPEHTAMTSALQNAGNFSNGSDRIGAETRFCCHNRAAKPAPARPSHKPIFGNIPGSSR